MTNDRLRVLHVTTDLDVGGAESMLSNLVTARWETGIEHAVASLIPNGALAPRLRSAGIPVHELNFRSVVAPLSAFTLAKLIRQSAPHVVQGWMYHGNLAASVGLALAGRRQRTALIWGLRCSDMDLSQYSAQLRIVVRLGAIWSAGPDVVTANSDVGLAWHLKLGYAPRRSLVIPNGIDVDRFRPDAESRQAIRAALRLSPDAFVLAHVARLDPMKDQKTFLSALEKLPGVYALMIGAGTERLSDQPRVLRLGHRDDVAQLLASSDAIVSSSAYGEGFCTALAEGMACGLPAVATDVGDARLIIGDTGYVVPARDPGAFIEVIQNMCAEGSGEWAARGEAARQRIVANFSLERAEHRFAELYRQLAASDVNASAS